MKRVSIVLEENLFDSIKKISDDIDRSMNYTISLLLQQAVKEKNRKRNAKKSTTEYHSPNLGKSNTTG
jgi:hypothetical protein